MKKETPHTIEEIEETIRSAGIDCQRIMHDKAGFSRTITFNVNNVKYTITWFRNVSNIIIGDYGTGARIPFRFVEIDRSFPLVGGNLSLSFGYSREFFLGRMKNIYESFRIPISQNKMDPEKVFEAAK